MSEEEQDSEDRRDWKDDAALEAGLDATGCCLMSLLHAFALLLLPVSALLVMIR